MTDMPLSPRVLALANQKGGVGKTTTAINLGTALAAIGENVLIVDLDPQGNASTGLGIDSKSRRRSTYDVLTRQVTMREAILETAVPRLHIVPSTIHLSGAEVELVPAMARETRLKEEARLARNVDSEELAQKIQELDTARDLVAQWEASYGELEVQCEGWQEEARRQNELWVNQGETIFNLEEQNKNLYDNFSGLVEFCRQLMVELP